MRERRAAVAAAWQHRDFRFYSAARLVGILGAEAQAVGVAWQIYQMTHSALALGYTGLALFLPGLFFTLPAGHVADLFDRRTVLLACYVLQFGATLWLLDMTMHGVTQRGVDLWRAGVDWAGTVLQRAGGGGAGADAGAEGTLRQCGDVGVGDLSDCDGDGADVWRDSVYGVAGGDAVGAVDGSAGGVHASRWRALCCTW